MIAEITSLCPGHHNFTACVVGSASHMASITAGFPSQTYMYLCRLYQKSPQKWVIMFVSELIINWLGRDSKT
jgi:hypothetical protein